MAASATPRAAEPLRTRAAVVAVAYSGGRDSTALLHATARSAALLGQRVVALHIHHGLSPQADAWLAHAQAQVRAWAEAGLPVELQHECLAGAPAPGESIEAWARTGRHAALQRLALAAGADLLLLAHHRRDQAETFLLQALRGAGTAGLAAMPRQQWRQGLCWARPWLDHPREAVEAYVAVQGLAYVDDGSNADTRFARNHLRHALWPGLLAQSPGAEAALARSAEWAQQALALQQEMAALDLAAWAGAGPGLDPAGHGGRLPSPLRAADMLASLSPARAANALRAWLAQQLGQAAPASLVARLLRELPAARSGAQWPAGQGSPARGAPVLRVYRGVLSLDVPARPAAGSGPVPEPGPLPLGPLQPGPHPVPAWNGILDVCIVTSGGVAASALNKLDLRPREGGEQFQAHPRGLPRSLKKCWQSAGVAAAYREGPLVFQGPQLLFVPGLGLDARCLARPGEPQFTLRWRQNAA